MGKKEKLITKLLSHPKDFTFEDAETLLNYFDYKLTNKGKTSGSRVMFICDGKVPILLHKPHQRKELLCYQINDLVEKLKEENLI